MDWASALCAGIGGALGGGIGVWIGNKIPNTNKTTKTIITTVLVITLARVIPMTPLQGIIETAFFPKSRFLKSAAYLEVEMKKDSVIVEKLKTIPADQMNTVSRNWGREGLYWLSLEDLDNWNSYRLMLAAASEQICAGFMNGNIDQQSLEQGFEKISDEDAKKWFDLSLVSMKAAILNEGKFDANKNLEEFQAGLIQLLPLMIVEDRQRFVDVLQNTTTKSPQENCWATKTLHESVKKLPNEQRHQFLKVLASLG